MSIPDLPKLRVRNVFNLKLCTSLIYTMDRSNSKEQTDNQTSYDMV